MNYHNINHNDMLNGDGIRVTLFVSGCNHHCKGCQNPQTWDYNSGILFDEDAKEEIFEELSKDYISGLTLSGGDPLAPQNREEILKLCKEVKEKFPTKNIWCYTGYLYDQVKDLPIMNYIDVLVDGPFIESLLDVNFPYRGSTNQKIIELKEKNKC